MPGLALGLFITKPQPSGGTAIDGALTTELSEPLTAENGDILVFEPASGAAPAFSNNPFCPIVKEISLEYLL